MNKPTFIKRDNQECTCLLKAAAGYNCFHSHDELKGNIALYTDVQIIMNAAKENLCHYTELIDDVVFGKEDNKEGSDDKNDEFTRNILEEEKALNNEAIGNLQ